jgi:hypothetical protein
MAGMAYPGANMADLMENENARFTYKEEDAVCPSLFLDSKIRLKDIFKV